MNEYKPDFVTPPGDTIRELMETNNYDTYMMEGILWRSYKDVQTLLRGERPLEKIDAFFLEYWFGIPESFWLERERLYRESLQGRES